MNSVLFFALVLAFVAAAEACFYFVGYLAARPAERLRRRLRTVGTANAGVQLLRRRRLGSSVWVNELFSGLPLVERMEALLEQADSNATVPGLLVKMVVLAVMGAVAALFFHRAALGVILVPALGAAPVLLALRARAARTHKVSEQLPEALEMMARALKAGHALPAALKLVAQECPPPVAVEFAKAYEQQNLGLSLEAATNSMTERVPGCLDLKLLAVSVNIHSETGGNLVEVLEKIADTMRERFKFHSKLRALTAESRLSGIILAALPILMAVFMMASNPTYIAELTQGFGRVILAGGIGCWAVGVLWIRQVAKVAY